MSMYAEGALLVLAGAVVGSCLILGGYLMFGAIFGRDGEGLSNRS